MFKARYLLLVLFLLALVPWGGVWWDKAHAATAQVVPPGVQATEQLKVIQTQVEQARAACHHQLDCLREYQPAYFFKGWVLPDGTAWSPWHTQVRLLIFPSGQIVLRYAGVPVADCPTLLAAAPYRLAATTCQGQMPAGTAEGNVRLDLPL